PLIAGYWLTKYAMRVAWRCSGLASVIGLTLERRRCCVESPSTAWEDLPPAYAGELRENSSRRVRSARRHLRSPWVISHVWKRNNDVENQTSIGDVAGGPLA